MRAGRRRFGAAPWGARTSANALLAAAVFTGVAPYETAAQTVLPGITVTAPSPARSRRPRATAPAAPSPAPDPLIDTPLLISPDEGFAATTTLTPGELAR